MATLDDFEKCAWSLFSSIRDKDGSMRIGFRSAYGRLDRKMSLMLNEACRKNYISVVSDSFGRKVTLLPKGYKYLYLLEEKLFDT